MINLPIGLLGLCLTLRNAPAALARPGKGFDLPGQCTAILALGSLTAALTEASRLGWQHPFVLGALAFSLLAGWLFVRLESRSPHPMLPLALFRNSTFSVASTAGLIVNFAYYGLVFVFSLFFQTIQHFSPQQTGLAFLPMTAILMVMNVVAGHLITRLGPRRIMVAGLVMAAVGYLLLLPVTAEGAYGRLVLPMLLAASGIALTIPTMTNATLSAVDASRAGIASGVLNSARQIGGVLGVAVFGFLVRSAEPALFMAGMHIAIAVAGVLLAIGAILSYFGVQSAQSSGSTAPKPVAAAR